VETLTPSFGQRDIGGSSHQPLDIASVWVHPGVSILTNVSPSPAGGARGRGVNARGAGRGPCSRGLAPGTRAYDALDRLVLRGRVTLRAKSAIHLIRIERNIHRVALYVDREKCRLAGGTTENPRLVFRWSGCLSQTPGGSNYLGETT